MSENSEIQNNAKFANGKLMLTAREAGIDLDDFIATQLDNNSDNDASTEVEEDVRNISKRTTKKNKSDSINSNVTALAEETNALTKKVKRILKK